MCSFCSALTGCCLCLCLCLVAYMQKEAHEASEKYKEGKFILELAKTDQLP